MPSYTPAEVSALTGTSADRLRDWRRRGLLEGMGAQSAANPSAASDPNSDYQPSSPKGWVYSKGDVIRIAIARELMQLGIELKFAFQVAEFAAPYISVALGGTEEGSIFDARKTPYLVAYPTDMGKELIGSSPIQAVRMSDLNRFPEYARSSAVVIDFRQMTAALPKRLRDQFRGQA